MTIQTANCTQKLDEFLMSGWEILLAARKMVDAEAPDGALTFHYALTSRKVFVVSGIQDEGHLVYGADHQWSYSHHLPEPIRTLFDLYLPCLGSHAATSVVVGHLGQSVDSRIATVGGDSIFVTGEENRKHLHRMRALSHAVLVGAETVVADDPQLNTRSVSGPSPVRVVIDPRERISSATGIFHDKAAPTWLIHCSSTPKADEDVSTHVKRIWLSEDSGRLSMKNIVDALAQRGLRRLFVEGGGVTVSNMLRHNCLDFLQLAAAPVLVGEGRPAIQLPGIKVMKDALRPPFQLYRMDDDVLWNFDMRGIDVVNADNSDGLKQTAKSQGIPALQRVL